MSTEAQRGASPRRTMATVLAYGDLNSTFVAASVLPVAG